jgi:lipopolysaccharide transport system ATP-binding protein
MAVRLAFAAITHVDADILIIDEALAVGDAFFVQKCMRFLREFQQRGSILFVSHDSAAVTALCDRALWLEHGRIRMLDAAKTVSEAYLAQQFDVSADPQASAAAPESFGAGGATITAVALLDSSGQPVTLVGGDETLVLRADIRVGERITSPIVGFYVKDRLGQTLFGDNTWHTYAHAPLELSAGQQLRAEFGFIMPRLITGTYTIAVAIAAGTQETHVQHHWIHDALVFQVVQTHGGTGLVGIPMQTIQLTVEPRP